MKVKIYKVKIVDVEVKLSEFLNTRQAVIEYVDHPYYLDDEYYPSTPFVLINQDIDAGEPILHELGYILCDEEPENLKEYVLNNIDKFVQLGD